VKTIYLAILLWLPSQLLISQSLSETQNIIITTFKPITHKTNYQNSLGLRDFPVDKIKPLSADGHSFLLSFKDEINISMVLKNLRASGQYAMVQADGDIALRSDPPNDNLLNDQWYLEMVKAADAWNLSQGGSTALGDSIVIAVIDNGYDLNHEDLVDNIWVNQADIPGDGIDNDANGYIDDIYGWNFQSDNSDFSKKNHGTSVLGLIGAKGNNGKGITGINWKVKLMPISIDNKISSLLQAFDYIKEMRRLYNETNGKEGAFIVASTYSGGKNFQWAADNPVWCNMYDQMGEVGVLSIGATTNLNVDVDEFGDMPSTCTSDYLIMVTSTDEIDSKLISAGYGPKSVDIGAPGINLLTTHVDNIYHLFSGTSAATPLVAGTIGLLYSIPNLRIAQNNKTAPAQSALNIKSYVLNGAITISDLKNTTTTGGRLDLSNAIRRLSQANGGNRLGLQIDAIYPNPAVDQVNVTVHLDDLQDISWTILDSAGRTISQETEIPFDYPVATKVFNTSNWPTGNYFIKVKQGNFVKTKKVSIYH